MGLIKGPVCGTLMVFIGFSVVLITMAAVKVDADTCEGMPGMFSNSPVYGMKQCWCVPVELGARLQCPAGSPQPLDSSRRARSHGSRWQLCGLRLLVL